MGKAPELYIPNGFTIEDIIGWGTSGIVFLDSTSDTVVKSPLSESDGAAIKMEGEIYERFTKRGEHEGLLQYFGPFGTGIRIEFASNGGIFPFLQKHKSDISFEQRLKWCEELCYTLSFIHSNKIIHGDFKCNNIFLDGALHSKVGDFGGSSLDGSDLKAMVTASHRSPRVLKSIEGDIFALGSSFYEILTGQAPYAELEEDEIMDLFSESKFPETTSLGPMGDIIQGCWQGKFATAHKVCTEIKVIRTRSGSLYDALHALKAFATAFTISGLCLFAVYWKRLVNR